MLLTVPDVADELKVPVARVYDLVRKRVLPSVQIGRQVRVDQVALQKWIKRGGHSLGEISVDAARPLQINNA